MTLDLERVKSKDCREVARKLLGQPARSSRGYDVYYAPHRDDGRNPSFTVYATGFKDYGGDQAGGDVIALVQLVNGCDFKAAVEWLGGGGQATAPVSRPQPKPRTQRRTDEPPGLDWQAAAMEVIVAATRMLWSERGKAALLYLRNERGLLPEMIRTAQLGYVPGRPDEWRKIAGLNVPCGILIPWLIDKDVWALKVRRSAGTPKYQQVKGGSAGGLYMVDRVEAGSPVLVVEGEFDAMVVNQAPGCVCAVALGSASNTLRERWLDRMVTAPCVWARLDDDDAGTAGAARLLAISERVRTVQVPAPHKDINDLWLASVPTFASWLRKLVRE